jgi:hypothetical protein
VGGVAERGVLVIKRPGGGYDRWSARWGGTDRALDAVSQGTDPLSLPGADWRPAGDDPSFGSVVGSLDYLGTAALYRVDSGVTVFVPVWFGLPVAGRLAAPTAGGLVAVPSLWDARRLRAAVRDLKAAVADAVAAGSLPAPAAPLVLSAALAAIDGRERHLAPPFDAAAEG